MDEDAAKPQGYSGCGEMTMTAGREIQLFTPDWKRLRKWPAQHRAELRLCLRISVSAVLALAVAQVLELPLALWTVLTAIILTQISVGGSLKATLDYLASTIGGAIYAGARQLEAGPHRFERRSAGEVVAVLWAPAFQRGFSPFHLQDREF